MVTIFEYVEGITRDLILSHKTLESLDNKPGDLDIIRREWHRSVGLSVALADRITTSKITNETLVNMAKKCRKFTEYDFTQEIDMLYGLYSDDPNRLKNIRIKILEAFEESKLVKQMYITLEDMDTI
ncbi:MAG: hypothetical protein K8823_1108 [Cenarchaeum symbiont of Oopsacas minuta]|nr:hypothetical protein [Cenarchaeum symbiont of Oopsacas minuta]